MRKKGNVLVCLIVVFAVLTGCGKDSPKETGESREQAKAIQAEKNQKAIVSHQVLF